MKPRKPGLGDKAARTNRVHDEPDEELDGRFFFQNVKKLM
jgi:hypothetical protein